MANQLLIRHTPFASLGQVDSVDGRLSEFSLSVTTTLKDPYRLQTVTFKLSLKVKKTQIRKEKLKVTYSGTLVIAFLAAENENRQLGDFPQANFDYVPERFLLSVGTKSIT